MTEPNLETWPPVLRELVTLIGRDLTMQLVGAFGGLDQVYIPKAPKADHPWAAILGEAAWQRIVDAYGGQRINLPRGAFLRLRKAEILELGEQGIPHRQIALRTQTTERYVRYVLGPAPAKPVDPRQLKLL